VRGAKKNPAGKTYQVVRRGESYYVVGLSGQRPERMLIFHHPSGDVDDPSNKERMHGALYDFYQTRDDIHDGDEFETDFGTFYCRSFHVLDDAEVARWDAKHPRVNPAGACPKCGCAFAECECHDRGQDVALRAKLGKLLAEESVADEIANHVERGEFDKAERAARAHEDFFLRGYPDLKTALNLIRLRGGRR
jgi:hypothetical protein